MEFPVNVFFFLGVWHWYSSLRPLLDDSIHPTKNCSRVRLWNRLHGNLKFLNFFQTFCIYHKFCDLEFLSCFEPKPYFGKFVIMNNVFLLESNHSIFLKFGHLFPWPYLGIFACVENTLLYENHHKNPDPSPLPTITLSLLTKLNQAKCDDGRQCIWSFFQPPSLSNYNSLIHDLAQMMVGWIQVS